MQLNNWFNNSDDKNIWVIFGENEASIKIKVIKDEIEFWRTGFLQYFDNSCRRDEDNFINETLPLIIKECLSFTKYRNSDNTSYTYLKILCGMVKTIQHLIDKKWTKKENSITQLSEHRQMLIDFLRGNKIYNFLTPTKQAGCEFGIINKENSMRFKNFWQSNEEAETEIPEYVWSASINKFLQDKQIAVSKPILLNFFKNFEILAEILTISINDQTSTTSTYENPILNMRSFLNCCQAFAIYADQSDDIDLKMYASTLWNFIVCSQYEDDINTQLDYLNLIINNKRTNERKKKEVLLKIVERITDATKIERNEILNKIRESRIITFISKISNYYYDRCDRESAGEFWEKLSTIRENDLLFKTLLFINKHPIPLSLSLFSLIFIFYPLQALADETDCLWQAIDLNIFSAVIVYGLLVILLFLLILVLIITIIFKGISYAELMLPRISVAIIVGIVALAFEDTSWKVCVNMNWINWTIISVSVYLLSFLYIFMDINKVTRNLPPQEDVSNKKEDKNKVDIISKAMKTSFSVFSIGVLQAQLIALSISLLLGNDVLKFTNEEIHSSCIGFKVQIFNLFPVFFSPKLVILWTGLSLFIGSFVQLFWQNQRIDS